MEQRPDKTPGQTPGNPSEKSPRKRKRFGRILWILCKILFWMLLLLILLSAGGALIFWNWYLPDYLVDRVLPPWRERLGLDATELRIRRLGVTGADLEGFALTDPVGGKLAIDSIRVDYLPCWPDETGLCFTVEGVTLSGIEAAVSVKDGAVSIRGFSLKKVLDSIRALTQRQSGRTAASAGMPDLRAELHGVDVRDLRLLVELDGRRILLPANLRIVPLDAGWNRIGAEGEITPRGQSIRFKLEFDRAELRATLRLDADLRLESFGGLLPLRPAGTAKLEAETVLFLSGENLRATGQADLALHVTGSTLPAAFPEPVRLHQKFDLQFRTGDSAWQLIASGDVPLGPVSIKEDQVRLIRLNPVEWKLSASGSSGEPVHIAELSARTGNLDLEGYGFQLHAPLVQLGLSDAGLLLTSGGMSLENPDQGIQIRNLNLTLPLPPTAKLPGTLDAGEIRYRETTLGKVATTVGIENNSFELNGEFTTPHFPNARLDFHGRLTPREESAPDLLFEVTLPAFTPPEPLRLGTYLPALGEASATATVSLGAALRLEDGKLSTGAHLFLDHGKLSLPETDTDLEEIRLDLRFEDLLGVRTPSAQQFSIGKIRAGEMEFTDFQTAFQIQSKERIDLESVRVGWCGGEIYMRPLAILTNRTSWNTVLYCENLDLAELIRQTGVAAASGSGALYGKIPVRVNRNGIFFDRSYLYSLPGEAHKIRIEDAGTMAGGMSKQALEQAQMEFAVEALKSFDYNWVKLQLNTDEQDLIISLQFDGKPDRPLPFSYDEENGRLQRDPEGKATFQGIQLNINTRLPLNRVLRLNEKLKQLMEKKP